MFPVKFLRGRSAPRRPVVVLAGLLVLVFVGEGALRVAFGGGSGGVSSLPPWLPRFGSVGETVFAYALLFDALKFVAVPAALVWVGYAYGRRSAVPGE